VSSRDKWSEQRNCDQRDCGTEVHGANFPCSGVTEHLMRQCATWLEITQRLRRVNTSRGKLFVELVRAQSIRRIDGGGATRRKITGERGDRYQNSRNDNVGEWIARTDSKEK
jgi:hypothetical protein